MNLIAFSMSRRYTVHFQTTPVVKTPLARARVIHTADAHWEPCLILTTAMSSDPQEGDGTVTLLLGAGASVEAGVPMASELTQLLSDFSQRFPDDSAVPIENLIRQVQVRMGAQLGIGGSTVNFELVLGALAELATRQMSLTFALFPSSDASILPSNDIATLSTQVARVFSIVRRHLDASPEAAAYLGGLLKVRPARTTLNVFTLNFDRTFEQALGQTRTRYTDGFRELKSHPGMSTWAPDEFVKKGLSVRLHKLHGSVDWGFLYSASAPDSEGAIVSSQTEKYLRAYPTLVKFERWQEIPVELPGTVARGIASAMNFGTRKELLYSATPFNELFYRFIQALSSTSVLVIIGYSFQDQRVNQIVEESIVRRQGRLQCVVVNPEVWRLSDNWRTVGGLQRESAVTLLNETLGESLSSGTLQSAIGEALERGRLRPRPTDWATTLEPLPLPISSTRDPDEVSQVWLSLGQHVDYLYALTSRTWERMHWRDSGRQIDLEAAILALRPFIPTARALARGFDRLMQAMDFGDYWGQAADKAVILMPKTGGPSGDDRACRRTIEQIAEWVRDSVSHLPQLH